MNYKLQDYYDELYRIFSCVDTLLTPSQTLMLGECLRSLAAGENISYKLERLYQGVKSNTKLAEPLENFMHHYTSWVEDNEIAEDDSKASKEDIENGTAKTATEQTSGTYASISQNLS